MGLDLVQVWGMAPSIWFGWKTWILGFGFWILWDLQHLGSGYVLDLGYEFRVCCEGFRFRVSGF